MIIRGREAHLIRSSFCQVEVPEIPRGASFFVQQAGPERLVGAQSLHENMQGRGYARRDRQCKLSTA